MEIQLEDLLTKIKKEGAQAAEEEAASIIAAAREEAKNIVAAANNEALAIQARAREQIKNLEAASATNLRQAGRDLILATQRSLTDIARTIIETEVKHNYSPDIIKETLSAVIPALVQKESSELVVLLPEQHCVHIQEYFKSKLKAELEAGVEFRPAPELKIGFRVGRKDGRAYYDFSSETLIEIISLRLNEHLSTIIHDCLSTK